ncbi:MAG TPA: hypothetical protein VM451_04150 [Candidatus Limnocylindria bacterium]|nr:hypothetical protein [Candidatus Limnocylindria bacterium]
MRRAMVALVWAALLLASLPGAVGAAAATKFTDRVLSIGCEIPIDGGLIYVSAEQSASFGGAASVTAWFDPDVPFESDPTATGFTDTISVTEGTTEVTISASVPVTDAAGASLGDATFTATLQKGEPFEETPFPSTNHHSSSTIITTPLEGTVTVNILGGTYEGACGGGITDLDVHESNPTSYVFDNKGVRLECFWETEDAVAFLFATQDAFGFGADAFLLTPDIETIGVGDVSGTVDASSFDVTIGLEDVATGDPVTATASGTFEPVGAPVTSTLVQDHSRTKVVEQALAPTGTLTFSTGDSFSLDAEHCQAEIFDSHSVSTAPKGPKGGAAPANDVPDGAIALAIGSRLNAQTTGTALDPEVPITTCPEGAFDDLGHTLWYTLEGTGDPVMIDTSGSNFDTVVAVYTADGDSFTEVGCNDDVSFQPIGASYQAVLTVDTDPGVTYYVQVGGYRPFFDPTVAQSGRLRLSIS